MQGNGEEKARYLADDRNKAGIAKVIGEQLAIFTLMTRGTLVTDLGADHIVDRALEKALAIIRDGLGPGQGYLNLGVDDLREFLPAADIALMRARREGRIIVSFAEPAGAAAVA